MIDFNLLTDTAICPTRGSAYSVGYDLYCPVNTLLGAQSTSKISLGISLMMDNYSLWAQIMDRSSLGKAGLHVFGGVVDPDYTGEICVLIHNTNKHDIQVEQGDRIAQMTFHPAITFDAETPKHVRGTGGFGSTGV